MSDYNEIERMFNKDSRDKKRIGSNAFRMTGKGKKGGLKHGILLGQSKFDKPYSKNTKTEITNYKNNICTFEMLMSFDEEKQKEILENWIKLFSINKIANGLNVSRPKLKKLMKDLDIKDISGFEAIRRGVTMNYEQVDMSEFTVDRFNRSMFMRLSPSQKYEVILKLRNEDKITNDALMDLLGKKKSTINTYISRWKKAWSDEKKRRSAAENNNEDKEGHISLPISSFETEGLDANPILENVNKPFDAFSGSDSDNNPTPTFNYSIQGQYDGRELANELISIADTIKGFNKVDASIRIKK